MSIHFKLRGNAQNKISQAFYAACQFVKTFKFQPCDHTPPGTQRL